MMPTMDELREKKRRIDELRALAGTDNYENVCAMKDGVKCKICGETLLSSLPPKKDRWEPAQRRYEKLRRHASGKWHVHLRCLESVKDQLSALGSVLNLPVERKDFWR